jgi:4-carboxymuconolactone decarboxylase
MARLPYVSPDGDVTERIRQRRGGRLTALDGVLLHSPPLADGWNSMLGAVRGASTLPADIRELAILRVASRNGADYEWSAHEPLARQAGLGDEAIGSVSAGTPGAHGGSGGGLSPAQWAALTYADAMTVQVAVPDAVFDAVRAHFGEREVLELTVTVAAYNMVSRVLVALDVRAGEDPFGARVLRSLSWLTVCCSCTRSRVPSPRPNSPTGTTTSTSPLGCPSPGSLTCAASRRPTVRCRRGWRPTTWRPAR